MKAWIVHYWPAVIPPRKRTSISQISSDPFYSKGTAIAFRHKINVKGGKADDPEPFELARRFALWLHITGVNDWRDYEPPSHDDPDATLLTGPPPPPRPLSPV